MEDLSIRSEPANPETTKPPPDPKNKAPFEWLATGASTYLNNGTRHLLVDFDNFEAIFAQNPALLLTPVNITEGLKNPADVKKERAEQKDLGEAIVTILEINDAYKASLKQGITAHLGFGDLDEGNRLVNVKVFFTDSDKKLTLPPSGIELNGSFNTVLKPPRIEEQIAIFDIQQNNAQQNK